MQDKNGVEMPIVDCVMNKNDVWEYQFDLGEGVNLALVWVPPGKFLMGMPHNLGVRRPKEGPQHSVHIKRGFWLGKFTLTQRQWIQVMGTRPWRGEFNVKEGDDYPAVHVSGSDARAFIRELSRQSGSGFRLPTEAEWEYACRAGTTEERYGELDAIAWYSGNSSNQLHPVGQKQPNAWGLYDMLGNVYEWCEDNFHDGYDGAPVDGRAWVGDGDSESIMARGGGFYTSGYICRSTFRLGKDDPDYRYSDYGFRLVWTAMSAAPITVEKKMEKPSESMIQELGLVKIPAGNFLMGSNMWDHEKPVHRVPIGYEFYLGATVVTQRQWVRVMGTRPWQDRNNYCVKVGDDYPAVYVDWKDAKKFIQRLNEQYGGGFRLPSEAEWEYACRAGTTTRYSFGDDESRLVEYGWCQDNCTSEKYAHRVRLKQSNGWGLYDMHGNVWEWCEDDSHDGYDGAPVDGSAWVGGDGMTSRILRGGGWESRRDSCCSAVRNGNFRRVCVADYGFRLVWA